jgi:hypothetical protein
MCPTPPFIDTSKFTTNDLAYLLRHIKSYDQTTALEILDQAKIILAKMLPGCAPRRFDLPDAPYGYWPVEPCFSSHGPIVPTLILTTSPPYYHLGQLYLVYRSMMRDPHDLGVSFTGPLIQGAFPLYIGPRAIADQLFDAIAKVDLAALVAAGAIERILVEQAPSPVPWPNLDLAVCAVYLGKYEEARELLQKALATADEKGRQYYGTLGPQAELYLSKLSADPDRLRQELIATVQFNWSHFPVVHQ